MKDAKKAVTLSTYVPLLLFTFPLCSVDKVSAFSPFFLPERCKRCTVLVGAQSKNCRGSSGLVEAKDQYIHLQVGSAQPQGLNGNGLAFSLSLLGWFGSNMITRHLLI